MWNDNNSNLKLAWPRFATDSVNCFKMSQLGVVYGAVGSWRLWPLELSTRILLLSLEISVTSIRMCQRR